MNPRLCQNCAVVDPNTDFEFNLQALASETGYTTTANGKDFLVRKMLECNCHFCATGFLHLRFLTNLQVNICSNVSKCGAGNAGCELENGVPLSQVGVERSLQYSTSGLLTLTYKGQLDQSTGTNMDTQHRRFCSSSPECTSNVVFLLISKTGHFHH